MTITTASPRRIAWPPLSTWLILFAGLTLSLWAWWFTHQAVVRQVEVLFESRSDRIAAAARDRMLAYEQVLRGGVALFLASDDVTREDWHHYVSELRVDRYYPGIQGLGFAIRLTPDQVVPHEATVRAEGFLDYRVWPEDERAEYTAIAYLEPMDWRNQRALGYDMYSEAVRREAMSRARDQGAAAVSGRVTLVQETDADIQAGFLMYLPLYRTQAIPDDIEARRQALVGYVYSPFRAADLMAGLLATDYPHIRLRIFDGHDTSTDALLFDSGDDGTTFDQTDGMQRTLEITTGGRPWTLAFEALPAFNRQIDHSKPLIMLLGGTSISLLIFAIAWSLGTSARRAIALARSEAEVMALNAELEQRVRARTAQLEASNRELESFSYSVSHDLRTPLRAIDGFSRLLEEELGPRLDPESARLLQVVRDNSQRMGVLIDDLLTFSRLGRTSLQTRKVDMAALANAAYRELAQGNDVSKVALDIGPLPTSEGDPTMLRQVWINLLSNALKFSSGRDLPRITISGNENAGELHYCIQDNGVGFDMRYVDKIFGVFQRLHAADEYPGTGVGLAIVHRVVTRHGGRVWAESVLEEGATLHFTLPLATVTERITSSSPDEG